jgi:hypothetical protein
MGSTQPLPGKHERPHDHRASIPQHDRDDHPDIDALLKENARLKELVVKLSGLVLKNIVDRS